MERTSERRATQDCQLLAFVESDGREPGAGLTLELNALDDDATLGVGFGERAARHRPLTMSKLKVIVNNSGQVLG